MMAKILASCLTVGAASGALGEMPWNTEELYAVPEVFPADGVEFAFEVPSTIRPVFFAGPDYHGNPTRIFAWIGMPEGVEGPVPGMVLVHGGGGTAFSEWVDYWNQRGYAAIAMDTVGCVPRTPFEGGDCRVRHENSPGPGDDIFNYTDAPQDRWPYHAVASVVLANSLLRSLPGVDADRIGLTGISWGGFLTCIAAGVDDRFALAAPVYGCGYLGDGGLAIGPFSGMPEDAVKEWLALWDPSNYLPLAAMPVLFSNDPNDPPFQQTSWQKSVRLPGKSYLSLRLGVGHSHAAGLVDEVVIFADHILKGDPSWPELLEYGFVDNKAFARWDDPSGLVKCELIYSADPVIDNTRKLQSAPAECRGDRVEAALPEGTLVWYINVTTRDGAVVSTPSEQVE